MASVPVVIPNQGRAGGTTDSIFARVLRRFAFREACQLHPGHFTDEVAIRSYPDDAHVCAMCHELGFDEFGNKSH
jgi:hypothetical protein